MKHKTTNNIESFSIPISILYEDMPAEMQTWIDLDTDYIYCDCEDHTPGWFDDQDIQILDIYFRWFNFLVAVYLPYEVLKLTKKYPWILSYIN